MRWRWSLRSSNSCVSYPRMNRGRPSWCQRGRPVAQRCAGPITRTLCTVRQATYVDGLWNGRPVVEWIPEVVDDVVEGFGPARVMVFGSVARGDDDSASDLDLLVLFDDLDASDRRRLMGRIRTAIAAPIPIDVLVAEVSEFEAGKDVNGSPYYWPARDGRVIYDRSAA